MRPGSPLFLFVCYRNIPFLSLPHKLSSLSQTGNGLFPVSVTGEMHCVIDPASSSSCAKREKTTFLYMTTWKVVFLACHIPGKLSSSLSYTGSWHFPYRLQLECSCFRCHVRTLRACIYKNNELIKNRF